MTKETRWLLNEKYSGIKTPEFFADLERLERGEPLAYIIGWVDFLGCRIDLSARPLIPRPETEFWVEKAILNIQRDYHVSSGRSIHGSLKKNTPTQKRVLDLFAGSGCIGISLLKHLPHAIVDFGEKDPRMCEQIKKNIAQNNIDPTRARIIQTDVFSNTDNPSDLGLSEMDEIRGAGKATRETYSHMLTELRCPRNEEVRHLRKSYDYIFANPPYIDPEKKDSVQDSVLHHEPHKALFADERGLHFIKKLLTKAGAHLNQEGLIYVEFGEAQKEAVAPLAKKLGWKSKFFKDQFGKWRVVELCKK